MSYEEEDLCIECLRSGSEDPEPICEQSRYYCKPHHQDLETPVSDYPEDDQSYMENLSK